MKFNLRKWSRVSLFNLMLVAFLGVVLRYKIAFSLPFIDQKYLLHSHSHFAFAGWVSQVLMALLVGYLADKGGHAFSKKYNWLLYANLVTAYGMLLSFAIQGYALVSIIFSTLSVFVSYFFAIIYWKDLDALPEAKTSHNWFKSAVFFNALSSLGAFALAFMMATKNTHQNWYLVCIYFFLHFQYNGWFFFACMGLLSQQLSSNHVSESKLKMVYKLFAWACVPAYFLSALWLPIPIWIYALVVISVFLQLAGWLIAWRLIKQALPAIGKSVDIFPQRLFLLCGLALTIKLLLQAGSVIPSLSQLAFGFRPIVIGYLHLVLLGVITLFIIAYVLAFNFIPVNQFTKTGVLIFTTGIILNETVLMAQGVADMQYLGIPFINETLFAISIILFTGMLLVNYGQMFSGNHLKDITTENNFSTIKKFI